MNLVSKEIVLDIFQNSEDALFDWRGQNGIHERCLAGGPICQNGIMGVGDGVSRRTEFAPTSVILDAIDERWGHISGLNGNILVSDYIQALRLGYVPTRGQEWTFLREDKKPMSLALFVPHIPNRNRNDECDFWVRTVPPTENEMLKILQSLPGGQNG